MERERKEERRTGEKMEGEEREGRREEGKARRRSDWSDGQGWDICKDDGGEPYYFHRRTGVTTYRHPADDYFMKKVSQSSSTTTTTTTTTSSLLLPLPLPLPAPATTAIPSSHSSSRSFLNLSGRSWRVVRVTSGRCRRERP
eukprot:763478-Hanusia_phi.AAC.3